MKLIEIDLLTIADSLILQEGAIAFVKVKTSITIDGRNDDRPK